MKTVVFAPIIDQISIGNITSRHLENNDEEIIVSCFPKKDSTLTNEDLKEFAEKAVSSCRDLELESIDGIYKDLAISQRGNEVYQVDASFAKCIAGDPKFLQQLQTENIRGVYIERKEVGEDRYQETGNIYFDKNQTQGNFVPGPYNYFATAVSKDNELRRQLEQLRSQDIVDIFFRIVSDQNGQKQADVSVECRSRFMVPLTLSSTARPVVSASQATGSFSSQSNVASDIKHVPFLIKSADVDLGLIAKLEQLAKSLALQSGVDDGKAEESQSSGTQPFMMSSFQFGDSSASGACDVNVEGTLSERTGNLFGLSFMQFPTANVSSAASALGVSNGNVDGPQANECQPMLIERG